jgi:hypothetical protein
MSSRDEYGFVGYIGENATNIVTAEFPGDTHLPIRE